jgi:hypothetical protein
MPELGKMLVEDGVISATQLDEAVKTQVIFGGRLGTNLIELGYLDEQTLTKYLVKRHNMPTVDWHSINRIKPGLLKLFPKKLAQKYEAFPVKLDGNKLWVVMADPAHLGAISEMSFATGKAIKPLVLPEVRIFDLLQRFYQIGRELRYINAAMMYKEKEPPPKAETKAQIGRIAVARHDRFKERIQVGAIGDLQSEEEFEKMATRMAGRTEAGEPPPSPTETASPPSTEATLPPPVEEITLPPAQPRVTAAPAAPPQPVEPAPAGRPAPRLGPQPLKETAQALYAILMKNGADKYVPKATLQEFLKIFVQSQLQARVLSLGHLANWLIMESDTPVEWLEKTMQQFRALESRLDIAIYLPGEKLPELPKAAPPAVAEAPPLPAEAPAAPEEEAVEELVEVSDEETAEEAAAEAEPAAAAVEEEVEEEEEIEALTLAQAQQKLMTEVRDRADISRIVLGFARGFFVRSLLFTVRSGTLFGWDGRGGTLNQKLAESITLGLTDPSMFKTVNDLKCHYLGPIPSTPTNSAFLEKMGGEKPNNAFLIPILVNEKVIYLLYGDNGQGRNVPFDIGELLILAQKIPPALDQLIRRKKQSHQEAA